MPIFGLQWCRHGQLKPRGLKVLRESQWIIIYDIWYGDIAPYNLCTYHVIKELIKMYIEFFNTLCHGANEITSQIKIPSATVLECPAGISHISENIIFCQDKHNCIKIDAAVTGP